MMKFLFWLAVSALYLSSFEKTPEYMLKADGLVTDLVYADGILLASTAVGTVEIFDTAAKSLKRVIHIPTIKDFLGDAIPAKIYSVDKLGGAILITAQGTKGFRELYLEKNGVVTKLIGTDQKLYIKKAKFVDADTVLLGLLSNELILYSIKEQKARYRVQISTSTFGDFALDQERQEVLTSDESGILSLVDVKSGKKKRVYEGENLDNVYQVDYKNGIAAGAGQDRRASIYKGGSAYYVKADFLVYSIGLSPKGSVCAFSANEANEIAVFDTDSGSIQGRLKGHGASLNKILFISETELFSSADEKKILFWRLK